MAANVQRSSSSLQARRPDDIRNILLAGQSGAGKTTLAERLLFATGTIQRMGSVEDGTTQSDFLDEEKAHRHSLRPTTLHFESEGHLVNLIDGPGLSDFAGHTIGCLPAVETACIVVDAVRGIEPMTRRMMKVARDRDLPRFIIINKIDDPAADLWNLTETIREEFGPECLPINLPLADRSGVADVFEHADGPATMFSSEPEAHARIVEQIVEVQEDLMTNYLETGDDSALDPARVHAAFEQALREAHLVPIAYCSAKTGAGIPELLHIFASLLPSPNEGNPRPFFKTLETPEGAVEKPVTPDADPDKPLLAHIFKVAADPFLGKLGVFRVHQGTVRAKSDLFIGDGKKPVRVAHLFKRQGKDHAEVDALGPGDIGAIAKLDEIAFDAVLHADHDYDGVHLKPLPMPKPVFGMAVELKDRGEEAKFATAVHKLMSEDPCLRVERIAATRETVMMGLGELHLRVAAEKLEKEYHLHLETRPPKVAYKETIQATAEGHHRHKKQTGGAGQFGEVYMRLSPLPADSEGPLEFINATVGGTIPKQFMPAIEKGVRQAMEEGVVAGYPVVGVRVEVTDGKHHPVDSKEVAFVTAGKRAFQDAFRKASPALLEPYVRVEVTCPSGCMGDVTGDLSTKRGRVSDTRMLAGDMVTIVAEVPQGEIAQFATRLKSMTQGAGSYTMEYSHDEPCPPHVQQEVIAQYESQRKGEPVEA